MSDQYPLPAPPARPPPPAAKGEYDEPPHRAGFSRGGFAPIPYRHGDYPPQQWENEPPRREREFPRRDLDPDWERRDWEEYDRPRRGGPGGYDDEYDRPKRRRSPSPQGPSTRPRHRSPSPPRHHSKANGMPDPASLQYQLSFRQFSDWFRASHPQTAKADEEELRKVRIAIEEGSMPESAARERVGMAKRYERYRKEYTSRQLFALYLSHRDSPWFQERYSHLPEFVALRRRLNRQGRVPNVENYIDQLKAGDFDDLSYDVPEEGDKKHGSRRFSDHEEPEGLDRALGDYNARGDDDGMRTEIAAKERQVFVKTLPPTISRREVEEVFSSVPGFQYLALGEPSAKKGFHRVAWAQFAEGTDVESVVRQIDETRIDTFTLHMGVNVTPTIGRVRVTAAIANSLRRLEHDLAQAKALAVKLEEDLLEDEEEEPKPDDPSTGEKRSGEAKMPGLREKASELVEEHISRLLGTKGLGGEDLDEEQKAQKAKTALDQWLSYLRNGLSTCYYCVAPTSFMEELHRKCISHMRPSPSTKPEVELEAIPESKPANGAGSPPPKAEAEAEADDEAEREGREDVDGREVEPKIEATEEKKAVTAKPGQKTGDERWEENVDHKIAPLLGEVDVVDYGGRDIEDETKKLTAPLIKQEEPTKYRCKDCNKLFKAPEFIIKHVATKHSDAVKPKLEELYTLNNFILDPQHLPATAQTPAAVDDELVSSIPVMGDDAANGGMNMMQTQMMMMMQMQQAMMMQMAGGGANGGGMGMGGGNMGAQGRVLADRMGGYARPPVSSEPLPPPPPGGEDPRARRGRVSYQDLDNAAGAGDDGGLPY